MPKNKIDTEAYIASFLANGGTIKHIPTKQRNYTEAQMHKAVMQPSRAMRAIYPAPLIAQELASA